MPDIVLTGDDGSTIVLSPPAAPNITLGGALVGPPGLTGPTGATGTPGAAGAAGIGVPTGGATGQILAKNSGANYDTGWENVPVTSVAGHTGAVNLVENDITSLTADLAAKAPLISPAFTGTPTAPTATLGDNTTKLATTAFVLANGGS